MDTKKLLLFNEYYTSLTDIIIPLDKESLYFTPYAQHRIYGRDDGCVYKTSIFSLILRPRLDSDLMEMSETNENYYNLRLQCTSTRLFITHYPNIIPTLGSTHVILVDYFDQSFPIFIKRDQFYDIKRYFKGGPRYFHFILDSLLYRIMNNQ